MSKYLFSPIEFINPRLNQSLKQSGNIVSKYTYLYWSVYGTKQEREEQEGIYRPELGLDFAKQKVDLLLLQLTDDEEQTLSADIDTLISIVSSKDYPKSSVQIPVELTGRPGVEPSFGTAYVGGSASMDWGLGGSILTPNGESYLLYTLKLLKAQLPSAKEETLEEINIKALYFLGKEPLPYEEPTGFKTGRFSSKVLDYQNFLKSIKRGNDL